MNTRCPFLCFACLFLFAVFASAQDEFEKKPSRSRFDFPKSAAAKLSISQPKGSLEPFGFTTRKVYGQVVDHKGLPVPNTLVALVKHIGFSDGAFDENFDMTDQSGRFVVEGQFDKVRLIVLQGKWAMHRKTISADQTSVQIKLPELASCEIKVDPDLIGDAVSIHVDTSEYWAGMASMGGPVGWDDNHVAKIKNMIPADYRVTINRSVPIGEATETAPVEIGSFTLTEGTSRSIELKRSGKRRLYGKLPFATAETPLVLKVIRQNGKYVDVYGMVDMVSVQKDGTFETEAIPPGFYKLLVVGPQVKQDNLRLGFSSGLARQRETYVKRIQVPDVDQPVEVVWEDNPQDSVRKMVEEQLEGNVYNTDLQLRSLLNYVDRAAVARELTDILSQDHVPHDWYERIGYTLVGMLNEEGVIDVVLNEVDRSVDSGRGAIWWLMRADKAFPRIIENLEKHRKCSHVNMRHAVHLVLLQIIQKDSSTKETILPWLLESLDDPNPETRFQVARVLGWIKATPAVAKLRELTRDQDLRVRVVSAVAIHEITGAEADRKAAIKLLTQRLFAKSLHGQVMAAQGLAQLGELPELTIKALLQKSKIVRSKDYSNLEKSTLNSLQSTSTSTLKKAAPASLEKMKE